MPSVYALKPAFQGLLRPLLRGMARLGCIANQVTLAALLLSLGVGGSLALFPDHPRLLLLLPGTLLVRMALNAMDGILAREFGQASRPRLRSKLAWAALNGSWTVPFFTIRAHNRRTFALNPENRFTMQEPARGEVNGRPNPDVQR